jgi:hypothetical protein
MSFTHNSTGAPHFHGHITAFDTNHNGTFEPELGEVTTNFDQLKFTCH